ATNNRIEIQSAPSLLRYGGEFDVQLDRAATNVARAAVIRNGSVTHSTDNDQRYIGLEIVSRSGNTIRLKAPPNGNVAPPGYYMLWLVDTAGDPCELAPFVRMAHLSCRVIADRSSFSEEEVQALGGGTNANFSKALYVDFDGFLNSELQGNPSFALKWTDGTDVPTDQITLQFAGRQTEANPPHPDIPTRITYAFDVVFPDMDAFTGWIDRKDFTVEFDLGGHKCSARIKLMKSANPYMIDVEPGGNNPSWLSTDVRVFKIRPGQTKYGGSFPSSPSANSPYTFIRGLIDRLNNGTQSFSALPTGGEEATLDGAYMGGVPLQPTFNFAVARVRYRATTSTAQNVRCFFRMCNVSTTGLAFNTATVYNSTGAPDPVPLLGVAGGQIVSIPFVNEPRIASVTGQAGATGLDSQPLNATYDIQDITPASSGAEVTVHFGVYLDINQPVKRFPINPSGDGPFPEASSLPIRDLIRSWHSCMVAEIWIDGDATEPDSTPSTSDNLSQRNLAIVGLENPGKSASRTAMHTFELSPSSLRKGEVFINPTLPGGQRIAAANQRIFHFPDELYFDWHNLPDDAEVTLYFSDFDTEDLQALLSSRISAPAFEILDSNTVRFKIGDCAWLPLPGERQVRVPALMSVALPDGIVEGQTYKATVRQVDGRTNRIIGSFTLEMPVSKASFLLPEAKRQSSFMSHILTTLDTSDRWRPLIERLVMHLDARIDALGGDSGKVRPNPDGTGEHYRPSDWMPGDAFPPGGFHSEDPCGDPRPVPCKDDDLTGDEDRCPIWPAWVVALLFALALITLGVAAPAVALTVLGLAIVGLGWVAYWIAKRCKGCATCRFLQGMILGCVAGTGVLAIGSILDPGSIRPLALVLASVGAIGSCVAAYLLDCFRIRCD
nr:galactose oxidase early set domain-containing protein [Erythrobacter sp.]